MNFIVYGKENCSFCEKTKNLLAAKGYDFTYLTLGVDYSKEELLELAPDVKTVPQIWSEVGTTTTYIGGFKELEAFFKDEVEHLLDEGYVVNVTFTKVDGTERTMRCTKNNNIISEVYSSPEKKTNRTRKENPDVLSVFDLDKNDWRSFRLDSVKEYSIVEEYDA